MIALALGVLAGAGGAWWWNRDAFDRDPEPHGIDFESKAPSRPADPALQDNVSQSRQTAITRAAAETGPAVVSVSITQTRVVGARPAFDDFLSRFFMPRFYREKVHSIGSGVLVSHDGYVVTNEHVTADADSIDVTLSDGRRFDARIVGSDQESDLAVLKIDGDGLPSARLGNSDSLLIGEWAIALGNPFGHLLGDPQPTVTVGVISALNRDVKQSPDDARIYRKVIQTDAAINPGNSGGPLVNANGEVIGINSFIFSSSRGSEGIGFAIPVNQAKVVIKDLVDYGEVRLAWVGVGIRSGQENNDAQAEFPRGAVVSTVQPESPADRAGLLPGDIITQAGRRVVSSAADWDGIAAFWRPGDRVNVRYLRGGQQGSAALSLAPRPLDAAPAENAKGGLWVVNITAPVASQLGIQDRRGVVVQRVEPGSHAQAVGFRRGDVIRQVNNREVTSAEDLSRSLVQLSTQGRALVGVERDGRLYLTALEL
jgi:serine protease Do